MRTGFRWGAALAVALAGALPALAHELVCEKTVNGENLVEVRDYPVTLTYRRTVFNVHPSLPSVLLSDRDSLFFATPIERNEEIPVGGSITSTDTLELESYDQCARLAGVDPELGTAVRLDNRYAASFEHGEAQCTARVVCRPPEESSPCGATRTMGFFKTHVSASAQCIAGGAIDLGFVTIPANDTAALLGLLWGSPARFDDGTRRNALDQARFLLGRQLAVAICNERLFGACLGTLQVEAVGALGGTGCGDIRTLVGVLAAFNESGDALPFPADFVPGPATPQAARDMADDPTSPSGQSCSQ